MSGLVLSNGNGSKVFDGLDLTVHEGERLFIYGLNGAGKSTLLKCMVGLIKPGEGRIHISGVGQPRPDRLLGKIGFLFQNPERQLFEETVFDEVGFSLKQMGFSGDALKARVLDALEMMGIVHLKDRSPLTLSFGEQHRVTLATVMAPGPKLLLLDEPFSGLDFSHRKKMLNILKGLCREKGTAVVIASHEFLPDGQWAHETVFLKEGRIEKRNYN